MIPTPGERWELTRAALLSSGAGDCWQGEGWSISNGDALDVEFREGEGEPVPVLWPAEEGHRLE